MADDKSRVFLENPFNTAGYASQAVFWWMNPFIRKGFNKDLELEDLYKPPSEDKSDDLGEKLQNEWKKELYNRRQGKTASFVRALNRTFGIGYIITGLWIAVGECIIRPLQAVSLGWLIHDVNIYLTLDPGASAELLNEYYMRSFYGGLILIFLSIVSVLTTHPYVFSTQHYGMKVRVACCHLIYRHSLKLSRAAIGQTTVGQMVNLLSNDVNRFDVALNYIQYLIVAPLQAIISITLLSVYYLGFYATIAGSAVLLLYIPFQSYMGRWFSTLRLQTANRTDERVRLMNEIIPAMRVIKMYVWEEPFAKLVELARENEVKLIRHTSVLRGINMALFFVSSKIILFLCFITYVELGYILDAEIVFVSITLFNAVRLLMTLFFPYGVAQLAETLISCSRLQEFLLLPEQESSQLLDHSKLPVSADEVRIECRDVSARWKILNDLSAGQQFKNLGGKKTSSGKSESLLASTANMSLLSEAQNGADSTEVSALRNITFRIKSSQLMVIVGRVGSGKSSVLLSILGELPITSGQMVIRGKISYSSQEPWIYSGTIRDNVLFGKAYNHERYKQVLSACALDRDIQLFPQGDDTLVGERGVSLSGGQKARVNLARALYYDADIYLLDDPLSAVDSAVAKHIFDNCIRGFLKDKIVILVTHQLQFAKSANSILYLDDGKQISFGNYSDNLDLMDFAGSHTDRSDSEQGKTLSSDDMQQGIRNKQAEFDSQQEQLSQRSLLFGSLDGSTKGTLANLGGDATKTVKSQDELTGEAPMKQNTESMTMQSTGLAVYWYYIKMTKGVILVPIVLFTNLITQVLFNGSDFWLSYWTDTEQRKASSPGGYEPVTLTDTLTLKENTIVYSSLILGLFLVSLVRTTGFFIACMRASINLHNHLFRSILKAPIKFFDYTPIGILLNRISRDMGIVDDLLPPTSFDTVEIGVNVIGILVTVAIIFPYMVVPAIFLLAIVVIIRLLYMKTVRSLKTIEGVTRSPVFSHLATSLNGLSTIRAFGVEDTFERKFDDYQDLHSSAWFLFIASSRWLGVALDWLSLGYIAVVTLVMTMTIGTFGITGSQLGLAISSALVLSGSFQWGVRQSTELESQMTSVARIKEYSELPEEPAAESDPNNKPDDDWPAKGQIEFRDVTLRYFATEEPVLKNLTFTVNAREKVGIVGRTGAGKSSMIAVLFRLTDTDGSVVIDGIDTKTLGLADLRRKISIIPQEPILFNGPVRRNLDPFAEYNDEQLWKSLAQVQLKDVVMDLPGGLDAKLNEGGGNFSVGQRQLICLARAILRQNRILILDEATANVDPETDKFIQKTIKNAFNHCTVLTIAHRLNTIMDSDKVLVLDAGQIKEFGEPHKLASIKGGWFSSMIDKTENLAPKLRKIAERSYRAKRSLNSNGRHDKQTEQQQRPASNQ